MLQIKVILINLCAYLSHQFTIIKHLTLQHNKSPKCYEKTTNTRSRHIRNNDGQSFGKKIAKKRMAKEEYIDEAPFQVMGSPDGKKEKKI